MKTGRYSYMPCRLHQNGSLAVLRLALGVILALAAGMTLAQAQRPHAESPAAHVRSHPGVISAQEKTVRKLFEQAVATAEQGKKTAAIRRYERIAQQYGGHRAAAPVRVLVAKALLNKGGLLSERNDANDAIYTYTRISRRFGNDKDPAVREQVASALAARAEAYYKQGNRLKALAAYEQLGKKYRSDDNDFIKQLISLTKWRTAEILSEHAPLSAHP
ncbi:MAG: tetratricopeptide repeat protein [Azoarcus sp.]|jgi:tetratricopeptide (TPR) repeat protein|nr:tetratricopeptide repeat protein [Azoarcus sp.]